MPFLQYDACLKKMTSSMNTIRESNGLYPDQIVCPGLDPNCLPNYQQAIKVVASRQLSDV